MPDLVNYFIAACEVINAQVCLRLQSKLIVRLI